MSFNSCKLLDKLLEKNINQNAKIDSYALLVRENDLESIDYKMITAPVTMYTQTAETFENLSVVPQIHKVNDITLRFNRIHLNSNQHFEGGYFIRFVITAKMLKGSYFNGLNLSNVDTILNYINNTKIITLTKDVLLDSIVNDIDICKDFYLHDKNYSLFMGVLYDLVMKSKKYAVSPYKSKDSPDNKGLIFGENRNLGTWSNPFIKFYNKSSELFSKSQLFYQTFLQYDFKNQYLKLNDLRRFEVTIKNNSHKTAIVKNRVIDIPKLKTLRDLYNVSTHGLDSIMTSYINKYFESKPKFKRGIELTPQDNMLAYTIDLAIKKGATQTEIFYMLEMCENKDSKKRMKKRLTRIFNYVTDTDYIKDLINTNVEIENFLEYLKINNKLGLSD